MVIVERRISKTAKAQGFIESTREAPITRGIVRFELELGGENVTFWLSLSSVVNKILMLILAIYVARILGPTEYGKFSLLTPNEDIPAGTRAK